MKLGRMGELARSLGRTAGGVLGTDSFSIEGQGLVEAVEGERQRSEDSGAEVFEDESGVIIVVESRLFAAEFPGDPQSYVKKLLRWKGEDWRIAGIVEGNAFHRLNCVDKEQGE